MDVGTLDDLLRRVFGDGKLQPAERKVLAEWLDRHATTEHHRSVARSRMFAIARDASASHGYAGALDCLDDTLKLLERDRTAAAAGAGETAQAFFSPGMSSIQEIIRRFDSARTSADVCVFTITDDRITESILHAHRRGIAVRIISDDDKSFDEGSDIARMAASGVPCRIDKGRTAHMHHKFAVFDRVRLLTGSFNWTRSATEHNEENLISLTDPGLVAAFLGRFDVLWERFQSP